MSSKKRLLGAGFLTSLPSFLTIIVLLGAAFLSRAADQPRPDLTGAVLDEAGKPVPEATVFIYTAGPRQGTGVLCPSCYADCRKKAATDANGRFTISSLDPELLFRVLVVAPEKRPEFVAKVDPAAKPLSVTLKPVQGGDAPDKRLRGRIVDPDGTPVHGAVISIRGVSRGESTRFGGNTNIDPVAVSDAAGNFVINATETFDAAGIDVEARGLAKAIFQKLQTGETNHLLKMSAGVTVKGRVLKDGQPLPGVAIGVAGANRRSEIFVGDFSVSTDKDGQFLFSNLPAKTQYQLYGVMSSFGTKGSVPSRVVNTQEDGSTVDVGGIEVKPSHVVEGRIRLTDGKPLTTNVHVMLSRKDAWDTQQTQAAPDGSFRFVGVPSESVSVHARVRGYLLSQRNRNLNSSGYAVVGLVMTNKTDLVLEFEPGERNQQYAISATDPESEPLRGAEAGKDPVGDIKVTGTVVDAETRAPLKSFSVIEGRRESFGENFTWFRNRKSEFKDGRFETSFFSQRLAPAVLIEADGYIPHASGAISTNGTNLVISLRKGSGPKGVVLKPDGKPAAKVTVYLTDMKNGVYVSDPDAKVRSSMWRGRSTKTDADGKFSFTPDIDHFAVLVLEDAGFAEVRVEQLATNDVVRLQPWARVEGQLMIGARPGTNENVRLGLAFVPYEHHPRNFSPLSFYLSTNTDASGKFVFERVPPIALQVYHSPKVRDARIGTIPEAQTVKFLPKPGETRQLVLGGKGRPVVGRVVVTNYEGKIDFRADVQSIETIVPQPPALPDMLAMSKDYSAKVRSADTDEEKKNLSAEFASQREEATAKTREFYKTDAGREYHFAKRRFALNFSQDGSFRIEDVPGGKYKLRIDLREGGDDMVSRFSAPQIARLEQDIEVPEAPGGRSDEPYDLGTLELQGKASMKVGKVAPDFDVKTVDGKPVKLADFKGKYLLLDFWAVWCGPCVAETPHLKAAYDAFKDNPKFAMLGLSLDPDVAAPRKYADKNELGWIQGFLGDGSKTDVPERFGVQGIPAIFLIGPDGKIIARDLRGPAIKSAIETALKK